MQAYLDNSATTRPSERCVEAMAQAMREQFYNPSSAYGPALDVERSMQLCRERIARHLRAPASDVYFTSGGTEANNLALIGAARAMREKGRVVLSAVEHPSVRESCEALAREGFEVVSAPVGADGALDMERFEALLAPGTALVSVMQVNNETGAIQPVAEVSRLVRARCPGALLHVDGVQGFARLPINARLLDFYSLSAHKLHGPKGVGALYARAGARLVPGQLGGGQERGLRAGTQNTPGIAGLNAALEDEPECAESARRTMRMKLEFLELLRAAVPEMLVNGPAPESGAPHILNVSFPGVKGEVLLHALEAQRVYVSTGSACSTRKVKVSPVLLAMGLSTERAECALRFSLSPFTAPEELAYAAECAAQNYQALKRFRRRS